MAISCDALQVYEGLAVADRGRYAPRSRQSSSTGWWGSCRSREPFNVGDYMPLAHAEIDAALEAGRRPIVVGGTGLYLRAALAELSLVKAPPESEDSELWSPETRHPTTIFGLDMDRERLYERIDARTEAIVAGGRREEVDRGRSAGPSRTARKALGFDELLERRPRADEAALPQLRPPPAHLDAQDSQPALDRSHRARRRRRRGRDRRRSCGAIGCPRCDSRSGRRWATTT